MTKIYHLTRKFGQGTSYPNLSALINKIAASGYRLRHINTTGNTASLTVSPPMHWMQTCRTWQTYVDKGEKRPDKKINELLASVNKKGWQAISVKARKIEDIWPKLKRDRWEITLLMEKEE